MKKAILSILAVLYSSVLLIAQDVPEKVNVDVKTGNDNWYASPWVWIVGAAVFILLLVALTRGGRRAD